ncbi:MAG TPA: hypothetical protein VLA05_09235 [Coriobacteriia bacterium]|nr:hypothetical protein [Coriobacteriia bacterium]
MTTRLDIAEVTGPDGPVAQLRKVLVVLRPSWHASFLSGANPSLRFEIRETEEPNVCTGRVAGVDNDVHLIEIAISDPAPLDQLRHCVAHELGHVLINTWTRDSELTRGPAGEYAAERIGWQILRDAGLQPHTDVFVSPERYNQLAWLPVLARIIDELRSSPWRPGDDDTPHLRAQSRLFRAGWTLCRAEAYRRGQHDAGVEVPDEANIPDRLGQELDRVFASLEVNPFPAAITPQSMHGFLSQNTPAIMARQLDFVIDLPAVVDAVSADESEGRQAA